MITMFNQVWRYTMLTRPQEPASPLFCPPSRAVKMPFFFFFFFLAKQPSIRGIAPRPYTVTAPWIEWDIARVRCFANETQRIVNGHVHHIVNRTDPRCISSHPLSSFFPPLFHRVYFPFSFFWSRSRFHRFVNLFPCRFVIRLSISPVRFLDTFYRRWYFKIFSSVYFPVKRNTNVASRNRPNICVIPS